MHANWLTFAFLTVAYFSGPCMADDFCQFTKNKRCSIPFPPGKRGIGTSWWAIGNKSLNATIIRMKMGMTAPPAPLMAQGAMLLNPSLDNANIKNPPHDDSEPGLPFAQYPIVASPWDICGQAPDAWCAFPSFYNNGTSSSGNTYSEPPAPSYPPASQISPAGDTTLLLDFNYERNNRFGVAAQTKANGATSSLLGTNARRPDQFPAPWQVWLKTECLCGARVHIPSHTYTNMTITLDHKVPNFSTYISTQDAINSPPQTTDGGQTWTIETITVYGSWCQNDKQCARWDTNT